MGNRTARVGVGLSVFLAGLVGVSSAGAGLTPTRDPGVLASGLSSGSLITGATFLTLPPDFKPAAVSTRRAVGFPRGGGKYAVMSTGNARYLYGRFGAFLSTQVGGSNIRGDTDYDVTILKIDISVPTKRNCLSFDIRMLSEEYPEWPGKVFNDAFIAELDVTDWVTVNSRVIAPHNFAFRTDAPGGNGQPLNIRTTGSTSANRANAGRTKFDGAIPLLRAITPVAPGPHSLYLSLFDQGDDIYDSAVFLDRLRAYRTKRLACPLGAFPVVKPVITAPRATIGPNGARTFRSRVRSESAIKKITVRLDGRLIYSRTEIPNDDRDLALRIPVGAQTAGVHTIVFRAENRAGFTTRTRSFGRSPGLTGRTLPG